MRPYVGVNPYGIKDPVIRQAVVALHEYCRHLNHIVGVPAEYPGGVVGPGSGGGGGASDHGDLTGLTDDDHPQYLLLSNRTGGQIISHLDNTATLLRLNHAGTGSASAFVIASGLSTFLDVRSNGEIRIGGNSGALVSIPSYGGFSSLRVGSTSYGPVLDFLPGVSTVNLRMSSESTLAIYSDTATGNVPLYATGSLTLYNNWSAATVTLTLNARSGFTSNAVELKDNSVLRAYQRFDGKLYIQHPNSGTAAYNNHALILLNQVPTLPTRLQNFIQCTNNSSSTVFSVDGYGLALATGIGIIDSTSGYKATLTGDPFTGDFDIFFKDLGSGSTQGYMVFDALSDTFFDVYLDSASRLRANTASAGIAFEDQTTSSKKLRMVLSGAVGDNSFTLTNSAARNYGFGNLGGNVVVVGDDPPAVASGALGKVDLTGQTAAIGSTALSNTPPAGLYSVQVYAVCTTASGSGTPNLDVTIGWTDVLGATTTNAVTGLLLSATGRASGRVLCQVASGNITYSTTINSASGSPQYAVYVRVVSLG